MFEWKDSYSVKIDAIDEQHKELLSIGARAEDLSKDFSEDKYDEIVGILSELKDYTIFHFSTEEKLFEQYNYPGYEEHKKEHELFVETLNAVDLDKLDEDHDSAIKKILNAIAKWVFMHIMNTDFKYSDYLIEAMK